MTAAEVERELADGFDRAMTRDRGWLLANPVSRVRDLYDNFAMGVLETAKDVPASAADLIISGVERVSRRNLGGRTVSRPTTESIKRQVVGGARGAGEVPATLRAGLRGELPSRPGRYIETTGRLPERTDPVAALGFRMAEASDRIGRPIATERVLFNAARAQAIREGKKGAAHRARTDELTRLARKGDAQADEIIREAEAQADLAVFMNDNEATRKWRDATAEGAGRFLQPIMPFSRSATNSAFRAFDYSPLSWAKKAMQNNLNIY